MSSTPFVPGHYVHVGDLPGVFKVLAFDGHTYRLRSPFGAELRAGRKAVRPAPDKATATDAIGPSLQAVPHGRP